MEFKTKMKNVQTKDTQHLQIGRRRAGGLKTYHLIIIISISYHPLSRKKPRESLKRHNSLPQPESM